MKNQDLNPNDLFEGKRTSGENTSFWFSAVPGALAYKTLNRDVKTDVLVIGGGISGLTSAYCLAKEGRKVILVEDGFIGSGESGRTTGHLSFALDDRYFHLEGLFGEKNAALIADSHKKAIDWIEDIVKKHAFDCDFRRLDAYLFLHPGDTIESLEKEYAACKKAGIEAEMLNEVPGIALEKGKACIKFPGQAQFHILKYLKGLANAFIELGGEIFTESRAENITQNGADVNGFRVKANHIIVATNTPVNNLFSLHTRQWPYRTYVIGAKVPKGSLPYALWWDTGNQEAGGNQAYNYTRLAELDDNYDLLIAGGEDHKTGQADADDIPEQDRYKALESWLRKHFPVAKEIEFRWSGQIMEPNDSIAFIGENPGDENIYVITGDSGNGLTHGTLGGLIIKDIILGKDNPWIKIYTPSRHKLKTVGTFLHEIGNMLAQYGDWFSGGDIKEISELKPGQGAILSSGLRKTAVYMDDSEKLHVHSAVCPHLGGILQWNADEKSFDCPVHGSRFTAGGKVINGPASCDLKKININEKE